jgi:hypothetical protein
VPSSKSKRPAPERTGNEPLKTSLQGSSDDHSNRPTRDASQAVSRNLRAVHQVRLQYLARRLHGLGEKPLFHFLDEVERGADLHPHLERYVALPADFINANGGNRFTPSMHCIEDGNP